MRRRSAALSMFVPVLTLGVIGGFALRIADRPWPLCLAALVGCVLVLLGLVFRERLGGVARRVLGERMIAEVQSGRVLGGLFFTIVVVLVVWMLWPGMWMWAWYATLALASLLCACASLRLHPALILRLRGASGSLRRGGCWAG